MRREVEVSHAIFDLPVRKWFTPDADLDFSVRHFNRRAATPVGPAAGPHTQLAQNIALAWLAGSRIIELKTVQVEDRLDIPRPCIHVPNVGFNVEWSQELAVEQSALEYAKAAYLIAILSRTRAFDTLEASDADCDTVFDISVGYDLEGIRSSKVSGFLDALAQPVPLYDRLRDELTGDLAEFRDVPLPNPISDCVTLSTFHGCPADQIESIARYLVEERRLHTIIKLNPTLLGFQQVRHILHDELGYRHLTLLREAFEKDLQYDDGLEMVRRLREVAARRGSTIGAKFTNTLVVANDTRVFPTQSDPYMYLSGQPLHVISMTLMQRFRDELEFEFPVSFSAGIDAKNFATSVACGLVPVTTCTDLLRQGGYGRLPVYLRALGREMRRLGVTTRDAYVLAARGHGAVAAAKALQVMGGPRATTRAHPSANELPTALREAAAQAGLDAEAVVLEATRIAGRLNGQDIVPALAKDARYHARANAKPPRRVDETLALYDCINCDLCIPACPNDAIFAYEATPRDVTTTRFHGAEGTVREESGAGFLIRERHQLAVLEGACNECSNCEVYCPEHGAPFEVKERVFLTLADFERCPDLDGFCRDRDTLHARVGGAHIRATIDPASGRAFLVGPGCRCDMTWPNLELSAVPQVDEGGSLDTALLWRMRTVWEAIFESPTPNVVNPTGSRDA
jgi:putative selenate reductase